MNRGPLSWVVLLLVAGCVTPPAPRLSSTSPQKSPRPVPVVALVPTPTWPVRSTDSGPSELQAPRTTVDWVAPVFVPPAPEVVILPAVPQLPPALPLPAVRPLPVKEAPRSRSWTSVTQAKPVSSLPAPTPVAPPVAVPPKPQVTKSDSKPPSTVPVVPAPAVVPKAAPAPTAAASASLLPAEEVNGADFQWQDVNATVGNSVTLHFDKANWLYLDSPAQQKTLGFQSINRDKESTTFVFRPLNVGEYTLEFQRQDLANQATDVRKVKMTVVKSGTRSSATTTALAPQTSTVAPNDALEASRQLSASGKTAEAVQKLLQSYKADDMRINLELGRLLNQSGQDEEALSYLDKNLSLTGPDLQSTLELGTRLASVREPQKKLPAYLKLWTGGAGVPSEELFLTVQDTLRLQKMPQLLKDWSTRYAAWYPSPKLKDRYLYQLGQWLEEPGDTRDVRASWKAYNEVVQSYPLSPYWKAAGERAAYINRHFLQAR